MGKYFIYRLCRFSYKQQLLNYAITVITLLILFTSCYIFVWFQEDNEISDVVATIEQDEEVNPIVDKSGNYPLLDVDFTSYRENNSDVKAWLNIDSIDLSLPITQTYDNEFYLTHDVNKKKNKLGWVFLDARSSLVERTKNTVIYGHNTTTGKMFGSLKDFLSLNVIEETDKYIQMNTMKEQRVYEVFSVYVTGQENWEYIRSDFSDDEFKTFLKQVKDLNENTHFKANIDGVKEILTFSTCYGAIGTDKRLVIHAKIVTKKRR